MKESKRDINLEKKIDAYVKGNLSEDQADELWAELLEQPEYIRYLETEMDLAHIYQSNRAASLERIKNAGNRRKSQSTSGKRNRWWWYSAAAAVILAAVLTSVFMTGRHANIHQWANQKIVLGKNLASAMVTRSTKQIPPPDSLLNAGFNAAIDGDIKEAIEIYHLAIKKYDKPKIVAKANLNLGILQYNSSNYKASIQHFSNAIEHSSHLGLLKERAYWYMGNAYINLGQLKNAKAAISHAHAIGKIYNDEESKLLKRLEHSIKNGDKNDSEKG